MRLNRGVLCDGALADFLSRRRAHLNAPKCGRRLWLGTRCGRMGVSVGIVGLCASSGFGVLIAPLLVRGMTGVSGMTVSGVRAPDDWRLNRRAINAIRGRGVRRERARRRMRLRGSRCRGDDLRRACENNEG